MLVHTHSRVMSVPILPFTSNLLDYILMGNWKQLMTFILHTSCQTPLKSIVRRGEPQLDGRNGVHCSCNCSSEIENMPGLHLKDKNSWEPYKTLLDMIVLALSSSLRNKRLTTVLKGTLSQTMVTIILCD